MLAGFTLGASAIASPLPHTKVFLAGVFYPALTFTYPIFDTMLVSVLRKFAGRPISVGGRDHSSHRLVSLGLCDSRVVWILWLLAALGCGIGLMVQWMPLGLIAAGGLLSVALAVFGIFLATLPPYPLSRSFPEGAWIRRYVPSLRAGVILILDVTLAAIALLFAYLGRFGPHVPSDQLRNLSLSLPLVILLHAGVCCYARTWELSWRSFGFYDVVPLVRTTVVSAACAFVGIGMMNLRSYSRAVIVLYCLFSVVLAALLRGTLPLLKVIFGATEFRGEGVLPEQPAQVHEQTRVKTTYAGGALR
jgi:UDP-GlcNAc:undecaprenyl-phosphate GlcNAc-1-phosphate transferase